MSCRLAGLKAHRHTQDEPTTYEEIMESERTTTTELSITQPRMIYLLNEDLASGLGLEVPP